MDTIKDLANVNLIGPVLADKRQELELLRKKIKRVQLYLNDSLTNGDSYQIIVNNMHTDLDKQLIREGFLSFEALSKQIADSSVYNNLNISMLDDLQVNSIYNRRQIGMFAHNQDMMKGMLLSYDNYSNEAIPNGIILYAEFSSDAEYSNVWISKNELLHYHLKNAQGTNAPSIIEPINDATINNKYPIHLFERQKKKTQYRYVGIFESIGLDENNRYVILRKVLKNDTDQDSLTDYESESDFFQEQVQTIIESNTIIEKPKGKKQEQLIGKYVKAYVYDRDPAVVAYALQRASGVCEICKKEAPFIKKKDLQPYLEVHHIVPLSKNGDDTPDNVVAICPNCHRKQHFG